MTNNIILAKTESGMSAALFVNGKLLLTLGEASSLVALCEKATTLANALQVELFSCTLPDPVTSNWAWQDMYSQASVRENTAAVVRVAHWEAYEGDITETPRPESHKFELIDLREDGGKARMILSRLSDAEDMLDVYMEVTSNPLDQAQAVPCAHLHASLDDALVSAYKVGDRVLLRPNTGVRLKTEEIAIDGSRELVHWLEDTN